ncbi:transposable element Tcb2 transposase [Trichonephila clavipes]|nr:transposable element Tcb2 transposase [Trichonephila clavipes]
MSLDLDNLPPISSPPYASDSFQENVLCSKTTTPLFTRHALFKHEHDDEVKHLTWCTQPPDLNINDPLWGYLENNVRARFPPPRTLFELETILHEKWVQIPMNFVQDLYFSIPRRLQAVIQVKGGPTTY